ncbi:protein YeeZ isoform X1 [Salvia divinorum]|uniref:Protein YeeZ isoform X1 n=1 Tax=Salvia divinorum TaxID=28513 RepID=A0ABD1HQY2_SALDI
MEIYGASRHLSQINLRFDQTFTFRPTTVRCNLFPEAKEFPELSTGNQMFILGMGFVGKFFAADLKNKGWVVRGSCTSTGKKKQLEELGYSAYAFDANDPQDEVLELVKNHTHLVISVPPLKGVGDPILYHEGLLERALKGGRLRWLVYLSSTSVYGDSGGAWVDENYPVKPESELARARLAAEEQWLCFGENLGIAAHVFRLGGIYGPGRSAIDTILKQGPMSKGQKERLLKDYTSRVHVADICRALHASILHPSPGKIYNIVDDDPAPREEVFEFARKLVEEKLPGHVYAESGEPVLVSKKPSKSAKRVSNARMKKELGVNLRYPSYRSGLGGIMEKMAPGS